MDHYEVLGIRADSGDEEIRQAYLAAARRYHPDFHDHDDRARAVAESRMRDVNLAWEELSDPARRAAYDAGRHGAATRPDPESRTDGAQWRPYDPGPDPGFDESHDRPITSGGIPNWLRLAPALAFAGGIVAIVLGGFTGLLPIVAAGLFSLVASLALFVLAPLVALTSSHRRSKPTGTR